MYAFIADIHIGTKLNKVDYLESLSAFLGHIKEYGEPCECIFVCGDLFDHRLTIDEAKFASLFLINLVCNHCGGNGRQHAPVRIIHGTFSHDYNQMEIFMPMLEKIDNVDVQYYNEACVGKLPNGASVLYLPQQYEGSVDYGDALDDDKHYDIIVGHGPISSNVKSPCPASHHDIVFPTEKLGKISSICVFGHYHEYTEFGDNVFYAGSMLRFRYGEDIDKVFFYCDHDYHVKTFKNEFALEYKIIDVYSPDELRDAISKDIASPTRFYIHTDNASLETYHAIMNTYKRNQNISYRIFTEKTDDDNHVNRPLNEMIKDTIELPIPSLLKFIKERYDLDVEEEVNEYVDKINRE
jgi:DNA repair exonuclease SbcCD nuclease subunit